MPNPRDNPVDFKLGHYPDAFVMAAWGATVV
jgi:hypothetical protein